jgi:hypothetical protein
MDFLSFFPLISNITISALHQYNRGSWSVSNLVLNTLYVLAQHPLDTLSYDYCQAMKFTVPLTILLGTILTSSFAIPIGHEPAALQVQEAKIAEREAISSVVEKDEVLARRGLRSSIMDFFDSVRVYGKSRKEAVAKKQQEQAVELENLEKDFARAKEAHKKKEIKAGQRIRAAFTYHRRRKGLTKEQDYAGIAAAQGAIKQKSARKQYNPFTTTQGIYDSCRHPKSPCFHFLDFSIYFAFVSSSLAQSDLHTSSLLLCSNRALLCSLSVKASKSETSSFSQQVL